MLLRIVFAIVVGVLVTSLMEWLLTSIPHSIDILAGIVAAFIAYWNFPAIYPGPTRPL